MGNNSSQYPNFQRQQWQIIQKNHNHTLWRSRNLTNIHIEEYEIFTRNDQQLKQSKQVFDLRYRHDQLVASLFFQQQRQQQFCAISHQYKLFIEKIPIRLIDIEHIPYPDFLHLYSQVLSGFYLIAKRYGCFQVQQQYIGVNQQGVVKVWMNRDYSRSSIVGGRITQEHMVKGIVQIIDTNCDIHRLEGRPTVRNYLYRNSDMLKFNQILRQLHNYIKQYNQGWIPKKLDCIDRVGGIYVIVNRQSISQQLQSTRTHNYFIRQPGEHPRPKLSSELHIKEPQMVVLPQKHQQPVIFDQAQSGNFGLKNSEAFPHPKRQQYIIPPSFVREDMEVIRRRRSQYQNQNAHFAHKNELKSMKYSQTIGQPIIHNLHPAPGAICFTLSPKKNNIQQFQSRPVQVVGRKPSHIEEFSQIRHSSQFNANNVTFKVLNQFSQSHQPQIDINLHNTSLANMSSNTSRQNTNRVQYPPSDREQQIVERKYQQRGYQIKRPHLPSQSSDVQFQNQTFKKKNNSKSEYPVEKVIYQKNIIQKELNIQKKQYDQSSYQLKNKQLQPQYQNSLISKKLKQKQYQPYKSFQGQPYNIKAISLEGRTDTKNEQKSSPIIHENYKNKYSSINIYKQQPSYHSQQPLNINLTMDKCKGVSVDDGKSSEQFLRQLKQIKSSIHQNSQENTKSAFTYKIYYQRPTHTSETHDQYRSNNFYKQNQNNQYDPMLYHNPGNLNINFDSEDFGRNTVSNIIETQQSPVTNKNYLLVRSNTPFLFEKNLEMKYSMLGEQSEPLSQSSFKDYNNNIDSDILADLRKIQS